MGRTSMLAQLLQMPFANATTPQKMHRHADPRPRLLSTASDVFRGLT